ncbi:hypothetical protein JZX87_23440 [Agrobacterium sp. Ap1]|jgi:hypothetical protein|uniref:DUF6894 family protein n=1 Tax=Rhizobium sp. ZW T2_16 TaxID=3378083 RepID=UPI0011D11E71|nr:hypothetical protein [Agrobacterium sp. Ap1]
MPRYYFHLRDGDRLDRDPEGTELATLDLAVEEVRHAARELLAHKILQGEVVDGQIFEITSEQGEVFDKIPLKSVVRFE